MISTLCGFGRRPRSNCPDVLLRRAKRLISNGALLAPSISERHPNNENERSNQQDDSSRIYHWGAVSLGRNCAPGIVVRAQALKNDQGNRRKILTRQKPCGTYQSPRP